jgi:hypothetical protein
MEVDLRSRLTPTDGVEVLSLGSSSDGASSMVVEGLSSTTSGVLALAMGGAKSLMEISSIAPSLSTRKLNNPKAMSKPPVLAKAGPVEPRTGPMMAVAVGLMSSPEAIIGLMSSMLTVGEASSMMVSMTDDTLSMTYGVLSMAVLMMIGTLSMAVSMAVSMMIATLSMAVVGEGAGESVDPDPVVPTFGTN